MSVRVLNDNVDLRDDFEERLSEIGVIADLIAAAAGDRIGIQGNGCICQSCGRTFRVDVLVPDKLWERIKPVGKAPGAGLLCGVCIFNRIEELGEFGALRLENGERPGFGRAFFGPDSQ